jgi:hypothetical protein
MRVDNASSVGCTTVDMAAVRGVADRIAAVAELVDEAVANHLARLSFDGARAGRAYVANGDALRAGLDRLAADVSAWSRVAAEVAVALRAGVDRYADAELYSAARIA